MAAGNKENTEQYENTELYAELHTELSSKFELEKTGYLTIEEITEILITEIRSLLDNNMEKLLTILYRIDVPQKKTDAIFSVHSKEDIAPLLADAIIKRQLEKIKTRNLYKGK